MSQQLTVYAPASMANISVGYDILGAAISPINGNFLGDCVSISPANSFSLINKGKFAHKLPADVESNIVYQCYLLFCERLGKTLNIQMTLEKNMPIGSGLGSSACSVVGALYALNEHQNRPFTQNELLYMMGELEGKISGSVHYDNVAPCYLGGMQLILASKNSISEPIPTFDNWYWVMAYPGINVSTAAAREILPHHYDKKTCIDHALYMGGFVHASYQKNQALAIEMLQDNIAEPYRKQLLPNFDKVTRGVKQLGALAAGISGSGPTIYVVADSLAIAEKTEQYLKQHYLQNDDGFTHICKIDPKGARVI